MASSAFSKKGNTAGTCDGVCDFDQFAQLFDKISKSPKLKPFVIAERKQKLSELVQRNTPAHLRPFLAGLLGVKFGEGLTVETVVVNYVVDALTIKGEGQKWSDIGSLRASCNSGLDLLGPEVYMYMLRSIHNHTVPFDSFSVGSFKPALQITEHAPCPLLELIGQGDEKNPHLLQLDDANVTYFTTSDRKRMSALFDSLAGPSRFISRDNFHRFLHRLLPNFLNTPPLEHFRNDLFRSFCPEPHSLAYLRKTDLLCGLIASHIDLNHGGRCGRIRTSMIYRFFAKSHQMSATEFRFFYKFTKSQQAATVAGAGKPGGYRPHAEIDAFDINEDEFSETRAIFKIKNQESGPTHNDFVDAIGRLKFRGTSNLLRMPTIMMEFVSPEKSAMRKRKRNRLDETVQFNLDGKFVSPSKSEISLASGDTDDSLIDTRFASLSRATIQRTVKNYKLAQHCVSLRRSGMITSVKSINEMFTLGNEAMGNSSKLSMQKSVSAFDKKSYANEMLEGLRYFGREQRKGTALTKTAYSWGSTNPDNIADCLLSLCEEVKAIVTKESRLLEIAAPCYIMGDLHGNYEDLSAFEKLLWRTGMILSPAKFLFLGDYVDRGEYGIECVAHLFAQKVIAPNKIFLIRGNHEHRDVQEHFSFQNECLTRFGAVKGDQLDVVLSHT